MAEVYDELVVDPCYPAWVDHLDRLWRTDAEGVRTVLDVCCGTGRLAVELVDRGYAVTGVDASAAMLELAARRLPGSVVLQRARLPDLPVDGPFDAAVSTFDSLNYLSPEDLRHTLSALGGRLRPGGWLVFDAHTDAMMRFTLANPVVCGLDHGRRFVVTTAVDVLARSCRTRIELSGGDGFTETHQQFFHSDATLREALGLAGLEVSAVTEEYTAEPAREDTLRATWVVRRPQEPSTRTIS
nr:class I SAM-dependent methyltransferase [Ornithinimicrobium sediminis]